MHSTFTLLDVFLLISSNSMSFVANNNYVTNVIDLLLTEEGVATR